MRLFLLSVLASLAFLGTAMGAGENADLQTKERIRALEEKLRCLVCQNQTLADSSAQLAGDLRRQVAEQVKAGRSDEEIIDYLVQRYGDFVLYDPPFKTSTLLLWVGPFVLLVGAGAFLVYTLRRRRNAPEEPALGVAERRVIERVLGPGDQP